MLIRIPQLLTCEELTRVRADLGRARWVNGQHTAGPQALAVKDNEQVSLDCPVLAELQQQVLQAVGRHPVFFSAALPRKIFNPLFNRYDESHPRYGAHIDAAVMQSRKPAGAVRTDLSCTIFLAEPADYDGGELSIHDTYGRQQIKLAAGDAVLYPGTSVHEVMPVTRGARLASFFWVESMVRSDEQRRLLYELDMNLLAWRQHHGESTQATALTGTYHNLLRMWADT